MRAGLEVVRNAVFLSDGAEMRALFEALGEGESGYVFDAALGTIVV